MSDPTDFDELFSPKTPAAETVAEPSRVTTANARDVLVFDIETGPLPEDELLSLAPTFDPATLGEPPGEFDKSTVKYGNAKDPAKRAEKLAAAKAAHEKAVSDWRAKSNRAAFEWRQQCVSLAPLSPITGRVLAIGYHDSTGEISIDDGPDEETIIDNWLTEFADAHSSGCFLVGFNILGFDVPFLIRRAWKLGLPVPGFLNPACSNRCPTLVDLLDVWRCGSRYSPPKHVNDALETVARYFGLGGKLNGLNGGDFHKLWNGSEADREQAIAYLTRDVELTYAVAAKMGVTG